MKNKWGDETQCKSHRFSGEDDIHGILCVFNVVIKHTVLPVACKSTY